LYRLGQRLVQIFLVSRAAINQNGTRVDYSVEMRIGPLMAGDLEGLGNRSGLDFLLSNACCGLGPCQ
jgi:hypothetical protein